METFLTRKGRNFKLNITLNLNSSRFFYRCLDRNIFIILSFKFWIKNFFSFYIYIFTDDVFDIMVSGKGKYC